MVFHILHESHDVGGKSDGGGALPCVRDFFRGKNVFVTGASGFLGRTLIEMLLREAPDIGCIFVLLRAKKGKTPQERLTPMTDVKLFDRLRKEQPTALSKLRALAGDVEERGLGLSDEDASLLRHNVHVVFHVAASVRFDDPYKKAILTNVRGTREACELAIGMVNLKVFVHVSTAYTNVDKPINEEKLYPPPGDWRLYIKMAENIEQYPADILIGKLLGGYPNTYTYTKAIAEHVINEYKNQVPVAIVRPSIILGARYEPLSGWVDNTNGPLGLALAAQAGAIHSYILIDGAQLDTIPVDSVVNGIILMAIYRNFDRCSEKIPIVNATAYDKCLFDPEECNKLLRIMNYDFPLDNMYKPFLIEVSSKFLFYLLFYLIDIPISVFYEILLKIQGNKFSTMKLHRRIFIAYRKLFFFSLQKFNLPNTKLMELSNMASLQDRECFSISTDELNLTPYLLSMAMELKTYFCPKKEKPPTLQYVILEMIHYSVCAIILYIIWKIRLPCIVCNNLYALGRLLIL